MKKLLLLLYLSFCSAQGFAGSCPDGSEPVKSISADGTYFVYNCSGTQKDNTTSNSSSNDSSSGIDTYGGGNPPEEAILNNETLRYFLHRYLYLMPDWNLKFHTVKGSNSPFNFQFDLREDEYIKQQMQTTPLLSYLLYEDDKIVIDEITPKDRFGDMFADSSLYHSRSMGKSIASYIMGHAICDGTIESVDSRLDDWSVLEDTLYHNQKLIDMLNMSSGDSAYFRFGTNNLLLSGRNTNDESIQSIMKNEFKGSKKSYTQYYYSEPNPDSVLSYLLFKYGDAEFKKLLDDVFMKKARVRDEFIIGKHQNATKDEKSLFATNYASRYDYLRIAKAMLDDWQNDTCVGQYLKTIHERRVGKGARKVARDDSRVGMPKSYAGFFHTGYSGMENRPVMAMDGWGGQTITIDFERGRIIATLSIHDSMEFPKPTSFNWKKIVYEKIKNGKPASKSITTKTVKPVIDPEQLILDNKARKEAERKAKKYWVDYYDKILGTSAIGSGEEKSGLCKWASDIYIDFCSD